MLQIDEHMALKGHDSAGNAQSQVLAAKPPSFPEIARGAGDRIAAPVLGQVFIG
jgi:hypothetical protein